MTVAALLRDIEEQCFDTSPAILTPILNRVVRYPSSAQYLLIRALCRRTGTTKKSMSNLVRAHSARVYHVEQPVKKKLARPAAQV